MDQRHRPHNHRNANAFHDRTPRKIAKPRQGTQIKSNQREVEPYNMPASLFEDIQIIAKRNALVKTVQQRFKSLEEATDKEGYRQEIEKMNLTKEELAIYCPAYTTVSPPIIHESPIHVVQPKPVTIPPVFNNNASALLAKLLIIQQNSNK